MDSADSLSAVADEKCNHDNPTDKQKVRIGILYGLSIITL